jgi:hypothetical protein
VVWGRRGCVSRGMVTQEEGGARRDRSRSARKEGARRRKSWCMGRGAATGVTTHGERGCGASNWAALGTRVAKRKVG